MATAYFAGGCFWQIEADFRNVPGVTGTSVGYMGGQTENPTYQQVCTDRTGHAETVQVEYDPQQVSYEQLLETFWQIHDPTTLNRQGPDIGTQYRSAIFTTDREQELAAAKSVANAQSMFPRRIVTQVQPASSFWRAEDYHQQYLEKRGMATCRIPGMAAL
jgi:peptide-methionine (S)-S-oxide reductase